MATLTKHPSAFTSTTGFDGNFTNAGNAYADDALYATATTLRNKEVATNWRGFDFSTIPTGSVINSVNVYIKHKVDVSWAQGQWRSSVWEDVTISAALTAGVIGAIGNAQFTKASTNTTEDTWNYALSTLPTLTQLKATNFGLRAQGAQGNNGTTHTWSINDIYITVDYTPPFKPMKINIGGVWKDVLDGQINIGGVWKSIASIKQNVGGVWKTVY